METLGSLVVVLTVFVTVLFVRVLRLIRGVSNAERIANDALARAIAQKKVTDEHKVRLDRHVEIYGSQNDRLNVLDESVPALTERLKKLEEIESKRRLMAFAEQVTADSFKGLKRKAAKKTTK